MNKLFTIIAIIIVGVDFILMDCWVKLVIVEGVKIPLKIDYLDFQNILRRKRSLYFLLFCDIELNKNTFLGGMDVLTSSFGIISIKKSNVSVLYMHAAISLFYIVLFIFLKIEI